ncbi:hypothetical protein AOQ84DRAFT_222820, partial [Glonium stellatum]
DWGAKPASPGIGAACGLVIAGKESGRPAKARDGNIDLCPLLPSSGRPPPTTNDGGDDLVSEIITLPTPGPPASAMADLVGLQAQDLLETFHPSLECQAPDRLNTTLLPLDPSAARPPARHAVPDQPMSIASATPQVVILAAGLVERAGCQPGIVRTLAPPGWHFKTHTTRQ